MFDCLRGLNVSIGSTRTIVLGIARREIGVSAQGRGFERDFNGIWGGQEDALEASPVCYIRGRIRPEICPHADAVMSLSCCLCDARLVDVRAVRSYFLGDSTPRYSYVGLVDLPRPKLLHAQSEKGHLCEVVSSPIAVQP